MFGKARELWMEISLKKKLGLFAVMIVLVVGLSVVFDLVAINYVVGNFQQILDDNSRCHDLQEAMELETGAFAAYVRDRSQENEAEYRRSCVKSEQCLKALPFDYRQIGSERYARTWNIKNGYDSYRESRDQFLEMDAGEEGYIASLYDVYEMQEYLQTYIRRLVQVTLKAGNARYLEKLPGIYRMRYVVLAFSGGMLAVTVVLVRFLAKTLIDPIVLLAESSRKIARYDFGEPDLSVENKDEMGDLVKSFNKMKHATEGYINTLKKNSEIAQLLYQEEMERVETEKQLEAARMELLKSQINPHFLFNTLNTISGMAKLEGAKTTNRMIDSLGSLFRYNLKMSEQIVMLERELKVVEDYMFIQQMRFGGRVVYGCSLDLDPGEVTIPAFTLQPLVENAIIHGLARKEQGGRVFLRAWKTGKYAVISVADTGVGMEKEQQEGLFRALKESREGGKGTSKTGIGLGNIYRRIHTMYRDGKVMISGRQGKGMVVQLWIPQELSGEEKGGRPDVSGIDCGRRTDRADYPVPDPGTEFEG